MVSPNLVEIIEVDSVDHLHQHDGTAPEHELPQPFEPNGQVGDQIDTVYSPSYLPEGFSLVGSRVAFGHAVESIYASEQLQLFISQESKPGQPRMKRDYVEQVTVNDQPAYLVRGGWLQLEKDGTVSPVEWDPDINLSVILQRGSHWFLVSVYPNPAAHGFTQEELLKIAESIRLDQ